MSMRIHIIYPCICRESYTHIGVLGYFVAAAVHRPIVNDRLRVATPIC